MPLQHERTSDSKKSVGLRPPPSRAAGSTEAILIADARGNALYASRTASEILLWPRPPGSWAESSTEIAERLRSLLASSGRHRPAWPASLMLTSGRRRYICRSARLESPPERPATWVLVLERESPEPDALHVARRRYHFTDREEQVVGLLIGGMMTKEIAERLGISVNTVKAFIRLVMGKMGVTTRSGIVGRTLSNRGA